MNGLIASPLLSEEIKVALSGDIVFQRVGTFGEHEFRSLCQSACQVNLNLLVIDSTCTEDSGLITGIRAIRMQKDTRIILLAVDREPGDQTISSIISMGVHDIVGLSSDGEEMNRRGTFTPIIQHAIERPKRYADVARWHFNYEEDFGNDQLSRVKAKKEKVVKIQKEIEIKREIVNIPSDLLFVCNLSKRAGSSFFTANFARFLATYKIPITVVESPFAEPYFYHSTGLFMEEEFPYSLIHELAEGGIDANSSSLPVYKDIRWNVLDPRKNIANFDEQKLMMLLLRSGQSGLTLFDIGSDHDRYDQILQITQKIIVIIDAHPTDIVNNKNRLKRFITLQNSGRDVFFVVNKWSDSINKSQFIDGLNIEPVGYIPYIHPAIIYDAVYNHEMLLDGSHDTAELQDAFRTLAGNITSLHLDIPKKKKRFSFMSR